MDALLATHAIRADLLRTDDFHAFVQDRSECLLGLIEEAMGKSIPRDQTRPEGDDAGESVEELLESLDSEIPVAAE